MSMRQLSFILNFVTPNIRKDIKPVLPHPDTLTPVIRGKLVGLGLNCKIIAAAVSAANRCWRLIRLHQEVKGC